MAGTALDRRCRTRLRARTRRPPASAVRHERSKRSQTPARIQCDDAARHRFKADAREICRADHVGKGRGLRELLDLFDEIAISLGVAGDDPAERRNHVERIELVQPIEPWQIDMRKLEAEKPSARL